MGVATRSSEATTATPQSETSSPRLAAIKAPLKVLVRKHVCPWCSSAPNHSSWASPQCKQVQQKDLMKSGEAQPVIDPRYRFLTCVNCGDLGTLLVAVENLEFASCVLSQVTTWTLARNGPSLTLQLCFMVVPVELWVSII